MRNVRIVLGLMCLFFILSLVGACTKPQNIESTTEPVIETTTKEPIEVTPVIGRVDALRVAINPLTVTFNPFYPASEVDRWLSTLVFDGLLKREGDTFTGVLSEAWSVSANGNVFELKLKEALIFHDGSSVTTADVLFTYEQLMAASKQILGLSNLLEVSEVDEDTIRFTFNSVLETNYQVLTLPILSKKYYSHSNWSIESETFVNPMGTGPFVFASYDLDQGLKLVANEKDWRTNDVVKELFVVQMSKSAAYEAYKRGEVDIFDATNRPEIINEVKNADIGTIQTRLSETFTYIGFNHTRGLVSDLALRKALKLGFDREAFIANQWGEGGAVADVLYTSQNEALLASETHANLTYDPEQARMTLDEAGWIDTDGDGIRDKNGINLILNWLAFNDVSWSYNLAETAAAQWRLLGIDVRITYVDYRTMLTQLESNDTYDLWSIAWEMPGVATPDLLFGSDKTTALFNFGSYLNPDADEIFKTLNQVNTEEERKVLYDQWHTLFKADLPILPVSQLKKQWVFGKRLSQINVDAMQHLGDVIRQIEFGGSP